MPVAIYFIMGVYSECIITVIKQDKSRKLSGYNKYLSYPSFASPDLFYLGI
jgi:hypothetical protein